MSSDHRVESLLSAYGVAVQKGDVEAVARLFTKDAIILPPNRSEFLGRQAIQDFYSAIMGDGWQESVTVKDVQEDGETVFATGRYDTGEFAGHWLKVLKVQSDGSLQIHRWCWNLAG